MKLNAVFLGISVALAMQAIAQTPPATATPPTLAASTGLQVYPAKGQDATLQGKDEADCYTWSKTSTGFDPSTPVATAAKVEPPPPQAANGSRVRGAARGAAAGAVVGEIVDDDASKGAEAGAVAGAVVAGSRNRQARRANEQQAQAANQQAQAQADQHNAERAAGMEKFKKGMQACLEGRGYVVK
jgi:hypothetical protein